MRHFVMKWFNGFCKRANARAHALDNLGELICSQSPAIAGHTHAPPTIVFAAHAVISRVVVPAALPPQEIIDKPAPSSTQGHVAHLRQLCSMCFVVALGTEQRRAHAHNPRVTEHALEDVFKRIDAISGK